MKLRGKITGKKIWRRWGKVERQENREEKETTIIQKQQHIRLPCLQFQMVIRRQCQSSMTRMDIILNFAVTLVIGVISSDPGNCMTGSLWGRRNSSGPWRLDLFFLLAFCLRVFKVVFFKDIVLFCLKFKELLILCLEGN